LSSGRENRTDRGLIQSKVTGYGPNPKIEIDAEMNDFSEDSDEEEQTPMIVQENEKENFTAMLPGEELLQEKEIEEMEKNHLSPPRE
jgi:hypothetical protein